MMIHTAESFVWLTCRLPVLLLPINTYHLWWPCLKMSYPQNPTDFIIHAPLFSPFQRTWTQLIPDFCWQDQRPNMTQPPKTAMKPFSGFRFQFFLYFFHDELGLRSYWSSGTNPKLRLKDGINPSETERSRWPESQLVIRNVQRGCDHFDRLWSLDTLFFPRIFSPNMYICIYNYTYIYIQIYIYIHTHMYVSVLFHWDECLQCMRILTETYCMFFFLMGPQRWSKNGLGQLSGRRRLLLARLLAIITPW